MYSNINARFFVRGQPGFAVIEWRGIIIAPRIGDYVRVHGEARRRRVLKVTWMSAVLIDVLLSKQEDKVPCS